MNITPDFSVLGLALTVPLMGYVLAEGIIGKRSYDRMQRRRDEDPKALTGMYRTWIAGAWGSVALVLAVLAVSPGIAPSDLGLNLPAEASETLGMIAGVAFAMTVVALAIGLRGGLPQRQGATGLQPRTTAERWWAAAMSVTAGVCEEIVYRGFLIAFGVGVLGLETTPAALLALALFAAGHLYQGWQSMFLIALVGGALTRLYLTTGSLVLPIIVHALIDIMAIVVLPALNGRRSAETAG
ncbi:CPBP family intramembrane glutamic endopeptidase [Actinomadura algeriensis]|uniref:Membrane protease YdiL (CAAX protease family) n=1 Tax=Actinomadura algeriensis TaxID=1679523 RepID=A0ABR9JTY3_9ACTN|nr:CPBP family intramembrane glutamic endopeptidase [Actinomadura algeriensis]MBE1533864.1 membrane protease YdiL (CAAX protease family) [Actinomadura algeriensis]